MPFISATRLRIRSFRYLLPFFLYTFRSSRQLVQASGFLKGKTLMDKNFTFWTLTAWSDEAAMRAYRNSGAHKRAMPKLQKWCDEASVVHWQQETDALPDWMETYHHMTGRRTSKVKHPSPNHHSLQIDAPKLPTRREVHLRPGNCSSSYIFSLLMQCFDPFPCQGKKTSCTLKRFYPACL